MRLVIIVFLFIATTSVAEPVNVVEDFDDNGVQDFISVMPGDGGAGWKLVASMNGGQKSYLLDSSSLGAPDYFGLSIVQPGQYQTVCSKGYFECEPDELKIASFVTPGFRFFKIESSSRIYFWDRKGSSFVGVWESD